MISMDLNYKSLYYTFSSRRVASHGYRQLDQDRNRSLQASPFPPPYDRLYTKELDKVI